MNFVMPAETSIDLLIISRLSHEAGGLVTVDELARFMCLPAHHVVTRLLAMELPTHLALERINGVVLGAAMPQEFPPCA